MVDEIQENASAVDLPPVDHDLIAELRAESAATKAELEAAKVALSLAMANASAMASPLPPAAIQHNPNGGMHDNSGLTGGNVEPISTPVPMNY